MMILVALLAGCGGSKIYEKHYKMENLSWNRFRILQFEMEIDDNSKNYDIILALRHIPEIPYETIEVGCTIVTPSGETRYLEHEVRIRDKDGKLLGDGMGDLWDLEVPLRRSFQFDEKGSAMIELRNRMVKLETLGIIEVGLIVRESS
jgi:gliding motility-associated lipoprotein GldH